MQQGTSLRIHPSELKHFLRHVCMAGKDHKEREEARQDLHKQVKKIKKISLSKGTKKESMEKEIEQLNEKINLVLQKESKLLKYIRVDEDTVRHLTGKIRALENELAAAKKERDRAMTDNREEIKRLTGAITQLRSRMHEALKAKAYREERIKKLEEKVKKSAVKRPYP